MAEGATLRPVCFSFATLLPKSEELGNKVHLSVCLSVCLSFGMITQI